MAGDAALAAEDIVSLLYGILVGILIRLILRGRSKIAEYFLLCIPTLLIILSATSVVDSQIVNNGAGIFFGFIMTTIS